MLQPAAGDPARRESPRRARVGLLVALAGLLPVLIRVPFWVEALRLAPDGDTSIVGLMAQHGRAAATFWGKPYGSPLEAWLAAPFVAWLGPTPGAVRWPAFLLSLCLAPLAAALAARLARTASAPAALLLACPPAYFLLLAAQPPPFYPSLLVLEGLLLLGALELGRRLATERAGARLLLAAPAWGLVAGLALWTHLLSAAFVVPALLWLTWQAAAAARRGGAGLPLLSALGLLAAGVLAGSAPWWLRLAGDPTATAVLSLADQQAPGATWRHLTGLLPRLHEPLLGTLGAHVPLTADDPEQRVGLSLFGTVVLLMLNAGSLAGAAAALRADRAAVTPCALPARSVALLLASVVVTTVAAFPWPLRAGPDTLRFLTPAYLPLAVLVAYGASHGPRPRRAWLTLLPLVALHLQPAQALLAAWRQAAERGRPLLPDCRPLLHQLEQAGVRHAWASYDTAWCLTYLGAGRVVASQPWNERFPDWPLPYLDELRRAQDAAWILIPGVDFALPDPARFERRLRDLGARFQHAQVGPAHVYTAIRPPFVSPAERLGTTVALGDGDLHTRALEPGRGATTWTLPGPRALEALTLLGALEPPGLPDGLSLEVSSDGARFERVVRLRPGLAARGPVWFDRQLQPWTGLGALTVWLQGRTVLAVRVTPQPPVAAMGVAELLLHVSPAQASALAQPDLPAAWLAERARVRAAR